MRAPQGYESLDLSNSPDHGTISVGDLIVVSDHDDPTDISVFEVHSISRGNRAGTWFFAGRDHEGVRCSALIGETGAMPECDDLLAVFTPIMTKAARP